jgi:hypothetical protein
MASHSGTLNDKSLDGTHRSHRNGITTCPGWDVRRTAPLRAELPARADHAALTATTRCVAGESP